jgi:hypothetical protein
MDISAAPASSLPAPPNAATHAYWVMPGAIDPGSAPKFDRLVGTVALGLAPDRDFYERVEIYHTEIGDDYDRADEVAWERQRRYAARPWWPILSTAPLFARFTAVPVGFSTCALGFAFLWWVQRSLVMLSFAIFFALLASVFFLLRARWFPVLTPRARTLIMPEGEPVDIPARVRARITPPPDVLAREAPLITCQVCHAVRLVYDTASGMTVCPGCGTALPLYHWPIEMPTPNEEV